MTLWIIFAAMLLAGALFVCWPLYRVQRKLSIGSTIAALLIMLVGGGLYTLIGSPGAPSGPAASPSVDEMVAALEGRLQENPDDLAGWKMLGRSFMQMQNYPRAVSAFEQAMELEGGNDGNTISELAEAVLFQQGERVAGRSAQLFEQALSVSPNNPKALFYGGIAAIERGDKALAADRWESLLAQAPPPEIQEVLRTRIAEWRGTARADLTLAINITLGSQAMAELEPDTSVFIIARDPQQPSPPIAAARRQLAELPATVSLSDADAMIPGRLLSQFPRLEVVVRASLSGEPIAQPGDWFGAATIETSVTTSVDITIDGQVP
jgi:cytochrome c-type biogenesis protein CcmH